MDWCHKKLKEFSMYTSFDDIGEMSFAEPMSGELTRTQPSLEPVAMPLLS
jgi:hypothetical protein